MHLHGTPQQQRELHGCLWLGWKGCPLHFSSPTLGRINWIRRTLIVQIQTVILFPEDSQPQRWRSRFLSKPCTSCILHSDYFGITTARASGFSTYIIASSAVYRWRGYTQTKVQSFSCFQLLSFNPNLPTPQIECELRTKKVNTRETKERGGAGISKNSRYQPGIDSFERWFHETLYRLVGGVKRNEK